MFGKQVYLKRKCCEHNEKQVYGSNSGVELNEIVKFSKGIVTEGPN